MPRLKRGLRGHFCSTYNTEPWKANRGVIEVSHDVNPTIDNFPDFYETRALSR
jgi:hypothetical protein